MGSVGWAFGHTTSSKADNTKITHCCLQLFPHQLKVPLYLGKYLLNSKSNGPAVQGTELSSPRSQITRLAVIPDLI
jgi:hypothetical protein